MAPKRKQASDNSIEAPSDAPRSKRKRTEATKKESAKALQPESKTAKATAATATRKATAAKPKAAAKKSASAPEAKTATAPKAKAGMKAAYAKPAAKPKPAVRAKASAAKPKAAPKKAVAAKKAGGKETPAAAAKRQRARAPSKKAEEAAEDAAEDAAEEEKPSSSSRAVTKRKAASKPAAQPRAATKAAKPASKVTSDNKAAVAPKSKAATAPKAKVAPKKAAASTSKAAASKVAGRASSTRRSKAAAAEESKPEELPAIKEESKPAATGARRGHVAKAAPKEVVEEAAEASAAPMEGAETAAEALEKPRAKGKASAKPKAAAKPKAEPKARKAATKRKAGEAVEAAEEKPEASKEAALAEERPVKRRAVAKAKKAAEPLQAVEHPSHQKEPGQVYVIGAGDCGQLGVGEDDVEALRARLSPVASGAEIVQVAAGGMHSVALTAEGDVYTCGVNDEGALGRETKGAPWENSSQATGSTTDSYQWAKVEMPAEHGKVIQVSAGDSHTMALTEQGFIVGWGTFRNSSGVFSFSPRERLALLPCLVYSPTAPASQAVKIVSGTDHVVALLRGGKLLSWGTGEQGQLGRVGARLPERGLKELLLAPAEISLKRTAKAAAADPIVDIAAGNYSTFGLTQQGQVWAWGLNNYGQLGQEGEAPVMAPKQTKTLAGEAVAAVGPGQHHTLFLTQNGGLMSAGRPTYGRLGQKGVDTASDNPVPVPSDVHIQDTGLDSTSVASVVAGPEVSAALSADGRAWLWGFGTNSQLGNGSDDSDREVPSLLQGRALQGKRVMQVDFGGQHTLLVVIGDSATTSTAPAAATTTAEAAPLENSQAVGMDIDAPAQAEAAPLLQNGIMTGHAEEAAVGRVADVEPRQGDPLLQEASVAAAPPAENAGQLSTAPAGPTAPIAAAAAPAAPNVTPQVDSIAASGAPAALTHSASGEEPPQPADAAAAGADDAIAKASMAEPVQPTPQAYVQVGQVHGLGDPSNTATATYAAATAADAAAAEVALMVDSMINMPEAESATVAAQVIPTELEQANGLASSASLAAQPVSAPAASAQTSLPESSAQHPVPGHVPGYVEPVSTQPYGTSAAEMDIDHPEAQKGSDLDDWRKSFYALSGSKPM